MILMVFKSLSLFGFGLLKNLREPKNPRAKSPGGGVFSLKIALVKKYIPIS